MEFRNQENVLYFLVFKKCAKRKAMKELSKEDISLIYDPYPQPTHGDGLEPFVTCAEALSGLDEPEESLDLAQQKYSKAKYMGIHCQGQTEIKLNMIGFNNSFRASWEYRI